MSISISTQTLYWSIEYAGTNNIIGYTFTESLLPNARGYMALIAKASSCEEGSDSLAAKWNNTKSTVSQFRWRWRARINWRQAMQQSCALYCLWELINILFQKVYFKCRCVCGVHAFVSVCVQMCVHVCTCVRVVWGGGRWGHVCVRWRLLLTVLNCLSTSFQTRFSSRQSRNTALWWITAVGHLYISCMYSC